MKRFLKKDNFQLSDHEKENLWLEIQGDAPGGKKSGRSWRFSRPVMGLTTAVAAVLALVILVGKNDPVKEMTVAPPPRETTALSPAPQKTIGTESLTEVRLGKGTTKQPDEITAVVDTVPVPDPIEPEPVIIAGRIFEKETGDPLANANIMIEGTDRGLITDQEGRFKLERQVPGQEVTLRVKYLGYEDEVAKVTPQAGEESKLEIGMEPMVVATLQEFDVEGAEYMVEIKSAVKERTISAETFEKFAIDSANDPLSKQAGVVKGDGATPPKARVMAPSPTPDGTPGGSVTGGTTPPNGEPHELMYFDHTGVNPFVATEDDSLSTFAVDVDNASYTMARRYINDGHLPPQEAIRVEEFLNFFNAGYEQQSGETFAINLDGAPSRFGSGYHMVRVGLQGKSIPDDSRKAANLVFLIDISGSMDKGNRLGLVKSSLRILLDELREGDRVGIVVYGSRAEIRLEPTDISRKESILAAIEGLHSNGSTNAHDGLQKAYQMARENYEAHKLNRLILCSDGVANMGGSTKAEEMLEQIRRASDKGITLSTIGFGMGNYNDILMEELADQGDGNYYYVDQPDEAERVFRENLTGLLQTIARQVKVQVAFDGSRVKRWRLLGYENRDVADRDFRNDDVDAGEVGAGHQVTALYEIKLADDVTAGRLGTVHLRYEMPAHDSENAGEVEEISRELSLDLLSPNFHQAPARYRLQVVVTEFAEILRGSFWAKESRLADLVPVADGLAEELSDDLRVKELAELIRKAADLKSD
jgi:Ca-activated chloride channel homolog